MKKCVKCKVIKNETDFYANKKNKDSLSYSCKECSKKSSNKINKTFIGWSRRLYVNQEKTSLIGGYPPPNYNLEELRKWILFQTNFQNLWDLWVTSNYDLNLTLSCDRTDDYLGYDLNRLILTTWKSNRDKGHRDRKNGINNKASKAVIGINKKTGDIFEYYSTHEAGRVLKIPYTNIWSCCKGVKIKDGKGNYYTPRSARGYRWKFKNNIKQQK